MEILTRNICFPKGYTSIIIKPIGDIHLGAKNCDFDLLQKTLNWVQDTPNAYVLGMGDYCDCIYGQDSRFDMETTDPDFNTPEKQMDLLYKLLKPIRSRVLGLLTGNHEDKVRKVSGLDITRGLAHKLEVPYLGISSFIDLGFRWKNDKFCGRRLIVYAHHGHFAGKAKGGKITNLMNLSRFFEADIYLCGHCHDIFASVEERLFCSKSTIQKKRIIYGLTGTFLKTIEQGNRSYGEDKGYAPAKTGTISIKVHMNHSKLDLHCSQ